VIQLKLYKFDAVPAKQDYILDKMSDYLKLVEYLKYRKFDGDWNVALVDMRVKDLYSVLDIEQPDYLNINIYLKRDALNFVLLKYPKYREVQKSRWEEYLEIIGASSLQIEKSASSELFRRTAGNAQKIREALSELELLFYGEPVITTKHLNSVLLNEDIVYARDVILTALLKGNPAVPKRGHRLSKYQYGDADKLLEQLTQEIGLEATFYSLRKFCKKLYEEKQVFLHSGDCKESDVIKVVDVYEILHAYLCFLMSNPKQLYATMYNILRRRQNDSIFERTILTNYTKCNSTD
jgi:hypothetical protein